MINTEEEWGWMNNLPQQKSEGWFRRPSEKAIRYRQGKTKKQVKDSEVFLLWTFILVIIMWIIYGIDMIFNYLTTTGT